MVYNAPADTNTVKPHGIIYNSEKSIGGIHYYNPDETEAQNKTNKKVRFSVAKNKNSKTETPVLIIDSDPLKPENTVSKYGKKEEAPKSWRELREEKKEKERLLKEQKALEKAQKEQEKNEIAQEKNAYVVNIAGTEVNFMEQNIRKPNLSLQDKIWLDKAQYYFVNAKENGIRVGSAPVYTTYEILEALWATATQYNINPKRFLVQLYTESRFNPKTVGLAGERGIGQFKESTAKSLGFNWELIKGGDATYPYQAMAAARYVQMVGESAYNSAGTVGHRYSSKINRRLQQINDTEIPNNPS
jgi:hypothetical protein